MKGIYLLSSFLQSLERAVIIALLGVMILLSFSQLILRNFFSQGLLWADPFLRHLVLWIGFLGASLATQHEKHINIDMLTRFASPKVANYIHILTNAYAAIVCAFLARAGWTFLASEMESAEVLFTIGRSEFPAWWFQTIIPAGFVLMSFRFAIRVVERIHDALYPTDTHEHPSNIPTPDI